MIRILKTTVEQYLVLASFLVVGVTFEMPCAGNTECSCNIAKTSEFRLAYQV